MIDFSIDAAAYKGERWQLTHSLSVMSCVALMLV